MATLQRLIAVGQSAAFAQVDADSLAARAARSRLTATESQQVFKTLLDALANPGIIHQLPADVAARVPAALLPALALADVETSVAVVGGASSELTAGWLDAIVVATGARPAPVEDAQWITALGPVDAAQILSLRTGNALAPEDGARLAARVEGFAAKGCALSGPGIDGQVEIGIDGFGPMCLDALRSANRAYPAGVDTWLIADCGAVVGLPRSTRIEITNRTDH